MIEGIIGESEGEYFETTNETGDQQLRADVKADKIIERRFSKIPSVKAICSEEKRELIECHPDGRYYVGYDPIDGSSLVEVNMSVGTIYGIYEGGFEGRFLVASAYVVYGPGIELVIAHEGGVDFFVLEYGQFNKKKELKLGDKGKIMSPGATQKMWFPYHKSMIDSFFTEGYRLRYSGGMVPDCHQLLIKGGGMFSYPATLDKPKAKLRMIFEVLPFAYIFEKAGGMAVDGKNRLLDLKPEHIHDTVPCFFGTKYEITRVLETYARQED